MVFYDYVIKTNLLKNYNPMRTKSAIILLLIFGIVSTLFFCACTRDGFTINEVKYINSGGMIKPMKLMVIENKNDSLFLRQEARKVSRNSMNSPLMETLKSRMLATVKDTLNPGVGISAPQVGVGIQAIYVQRFDKPNEPFEFYFNPKIELLGDSINSGLEGCLSVPGYRGRVDRVHNIKIAYTDSIGNKKKEKISGFTAVIFQHEIDHLNGILFFDHIYGGFDSLMPSEF
jgi:peptide deformylase